LQKNNKQPFSTVALAKLCFLQEFDTVTRVYKEFPVGEIKAPILIRHLAPFRIISTAAKVYKRT
jgi:hypothetical protein